MLEGSHDLVFRNSFKDIRYALETLNSSGARYEFECYDTSHLYNLHYFWTEGLVKAPLFIQTCFGASWRHRFASGRRHAHEATADRLFGNNYRWSVLGAGRAQMPVAAMAASMGGNVRSGLKTASGSVRAASPRPMQSRSCKSARSSRGLGSRSQPRTKARAILELKGGDKVAF